MSPPKHLSTPSSFSQPRSSGQSPEVAPDRLISPSHPPLHLSHPVAPQSASRGAGSNLLSFPQWLPVVLGSSALPLQGIRGSATCPASALQHFPGSLSEHTVGGRVEALPSIFCFRRPGGILTKGRRGGSCPPRRPVLLDWGWALWDPGGGAQPPQRGLSPRLSRRNIHLVPVRCRFAGVH